MRKPLALAVVAILVGCQDGPPLGPEVDGPEAHRGPPETTGRFIVTLTDGSRPEQVARNHGVAPDFVYTRVLNGFAGSVAESARLGLLRDQRVTRVERDGVVQTTAPAPAPATVASTTTQTEPTWGLDRVDQRDNSLDGRYVYEFSGAGVTAYIVDTGIRYSHEEFGGRAVPGFDVLRDDGEDCHGHGTHVAGTVGGSTYGVAKAVRLVSVRVLQCSGAGTVSGVIAGLDWIGGNARLPAVANLSLGASASESLDDAVRRLVARGVTTVVAGGNWGEDACGYSPARVGEAFTLGATDKSDARSSFSNHGSCVDLFAPGRSITSAHYADDGALANMSGTSMAAPHAAGAAALHLEAYPGASPSQVLDALRARATHGVVSGAQSKNDHLLHTLGGEVPPPSEPEPLVAAFSFSCGELSCSFTDASDPDEALEKRHWEFGDGATSSEANPSHTYGSAGAYEVRLTVTDGSGRSDSTTEIVAVEEAEADEPDGIVLTLRGYKVKGRHHVDLEWSGAEGARVRILLAEELLDIVENGGAYTYGDDNRGKGTYTFQVCEEEVDRCSEVKTVDM